MTNMLKMVLHGIGVGEEFAHQVNYQLDVPVSAVELNAMATAWQGAVTSTLRGQLETLIGSDQHYDQVSFYFYATTPNDPATEVAHAPVTTLPGSGGTANPLQVAICVSTHTDFAGASNRGRMYLCATGLTPVARKFTSAQVDGAVAAAKGLIELGYAVTLANSSATSAVAVVFSPKKGTGTPITSVSADNVPDIQRRRAESETQSYIGSAAVVTA